MSRRDQRAVKRSTSPTNPVITDLTDPIYQGMPAEVARHFGYMACYGGNGKTWAAKLTSYLEWWRQASDPNIYHGATTRPLPPATLATFNHTGSDCRCHKPWPAPVPVIT